VSGTVGGVNLAFMFIAALNATPGVVTKWLSKIGFDPWITVSISKILGVALSTCTSRSVMDSHNHPAFAGLKESWVSRGQSGACTGGYWVT